MLGLLSLAELWFLYHALNASQHSLHVSWLLLHFGYLSRCLASYSATLTTILTSILSFRFVDRLAESQASVLTGEDVSTFECCRCDTRSLFFLIIGITVTVVGQQQDVGRTYWVSASGAGIWGGIFTLIPGILGKRMGEKVIFTLISGILGKMILEYSRMGKGGISTLIRGILGKRP